MKRGILSILAALALCLTLLPATALAEGTGTAEGPWTCGATAADTVTATLSEDGTLTISGSGAMTDYDYNSSDPPWKSNKSSILEVVIGDGVTSIGNSAFFRCDSIKTVSIASSVKSIGGDAFYGCTALTQVNIPGTVTSIGSSAFSSCSALEQVEIPASVTSISNSAFAFSGLTEVTIPGNVQTIGDYAFQYCNNLTTVTISDGVRTIASAAFTGCEKLTRVDIPASVTSIRTGAFARSTSAQIHYAGTTAEWNDLIGSTDIGVESNKVHTSDSDVTYQVTIVGGGEGASGEGEYREGATVTVSAGTKEGYAFTGWTVSLEGVDLGADFDSSKADTSFTMPGQDVTLTASWAEAVAMVDDVGYATVQAAFDAAASGGGRVFLLKNVTVDQAVTMSQGSVTLESEGKTLTGTGLTTISVGGGSLTLENVTVKNTSEGQVLAPGAVIPGTAINVSGSGKLTVSDGSAVRAEGKDGWALFYLGGEAYITIQGGTISGGEGFGFNTTGSFTADKISLLGGTFIGRTGSAVRVPGGFKLWHLVGEGLVLIDDDTKELVDLLEQSTGHGTFTVSCGHFGVESVTSSAPDENGVVTVTATCQRCKETVTLGTLTMVGSGQTITFGDEIPTFEVQAQGLGVNKYQWEGKELDPDSSYQDKPPFEKKVGDLSHSCQVTFNVPGGSTANVTLTFTLTVNPLDITNATVTAELNPGTATYTGQGQTPDIGIVSVNNTGYGSVSSCFDVALVDASGNGAETQTNAGTYKIKLTGKGPLTGTKTLDSPVFTIEKATPTIAWKNATKEMTYNGNVPVLDNELTVTLVNGETYDKNVNGAIAYSYATAENGDYTNGLPKNAGTYYIKASLPAKGNYTSADAPGTLTLTINKAKPTVTAPKAKNLTYTGKPQELVSAGSTDVGAPVLYAVAESAPGGTPVYSYSTTIPTATDSGPYKVYYKVEGTENYEGVSGTDMYVEATVEQATAGNIAGQVMYIQNNKEAAYTLDLNQFAPAPPFGHFGAESENPAQIDKPSYGALGYEIKVSDYFDKDRDVDSDNGILTIHVNNVNTTVEQDVAVITVSYTSYNFEPIKMPITIKAVNKTPVTITGVAAAGWTYDGTAHNGYTGTPSAGAYTGDLDVAYYKDGTKLDAVPKKAGTYTVTFSVPDSADCVGSKDLTFTVEPATVTVRADDKTATVGAARPELTWRVVSGLADGETLKTAPGLACDADMSKAGTYPITISGGAVPDGGNYKAQIVHQDGTLTVRSSGGGHSHRWAEEWSSDSARHWHRCLNGCSQRRDLADHVFDDEWDTECNVCGYVREAAHRHVWAGKWSSDGTHHWHECTAEGCGVTDNRQKDGYGEHVYDGEWDPECNVCGYVREAAHRHVWAGKWSSDGTHHWHECTAEGCGVTDNRQKDSYGEHVYDNSRDAVCNVCGYVRKVDRPSGGGSGGSGGGTSVTSYRVTVEKSEHGRVVSDCASAASGRTVTLTVTPDNGYALDTLTVTGSRGQGISLIGKDGKYTFAMPDEVVTVRGVFTLLPDDPEKECDGGADCPSHSFTDLGGVGTWYHEAVDYVLRNGLMNGYSAGFFGPDNRLTRAQLVQILYNHAGKPAAAGGGGFTDVAADAWCAPAIAWAAERGIAGGYGNGTFGPDDAITREQLAVMLWRYAGSPAAGQELSFHDAGKIGTHAREAICWAVESGVMSGKGGGVLDPKGLATRAQTAQMLKNFLENG